MKINQLAAAIACAVQPPDPCLFLAPAKPAKTAAQIVQTYPGESTEWHDDKYNAARVYSWAGNMAIALYLEKDGKVTQMEESNDFELPPMRFCDTAAALTKVLLSSESEIKAAGFTATVRKVITTMVGTPA